MKPKILILALDSATFDFILPMVERQELPNFKRLLDSGVYGLCDTTVPAHSAPAWITFMTGLNPGKHGVLGFNDLDLNNYSLTGDKIINSSLYKGRTIFDYLSNKNKRVVSFGLPTTYPPWEINGIMMAGYPTPDERMAFTSPEHYGKKFGQLVDMRIDMKLTAGYDVHIKGYHYENQKITDIALELLKQEEWDLFVYFNGILDSVQHTFWQFKNRLAPAYSPSLADKYSQVIEEMYKIVDLSVGRLIDAVDSNTTVLVVSDHGSGPRPLKAFNLNYWLKQNGYLTVSGGLTTKISSFSYNLLEFLKAKFPLRDLYRKWIPQKVKKNIALIKHNATAVNWAKTLAYPVELTYPYVGINLNVKNRQPRGYVEDHKYESTRSAIIKELTDLQDPENGANIIQEVYRKETLYNGPYLNNIPDLIVKLNEKYECGANLEEIISTASKAGYKKWSGYHLPQGIFIASGPNIKKTQKVQDISIADVAPTIMYVLGEAIPKNMDGRVLSHIFDKETGDIRYGDIDYIELGKRRGVLLEDKERKRALKALGYMD